MFANFALRLLCTSQIQLVCLAGFRVRSGTRRLLTSLACRANLLGSGDCPRKSVHLFAWARVQGLLPAVCSLILAVAKSEPGTFAIAPSVC